MKNKNPADLPVVFCDIDNCVSQDDWRLALIESEESDLWTRFHQYHQHCIFDAPRNFDLVEKTLADARRIFGAPKATLIFITAMPVRYLPLRQWWFNEHLPPRLIGSVSPYTVCRPNDNQEPSAQLKPRIIASLIDKGAIKKSNIYVAYDDRRDVVEAYRREKIPAEQIAITDQSEYHRGTH